MLLEFKTGIGDKRRTVFTITDSHVPRIGETVSLVEDDGQIGHYEVTHVQYSYEHGKEVSAIVHLKDYYC